MSSPIHHLDDDTEPTLGYAPPWARERILPVAEPPPRPRARTPAAVEMSSGKFKPKFSGDRAMLALQRQLADDPGLIPEPSFKATPVIRPLLIRLCSVAALAAFVAWGCRVLFGCEENRRNRHVHSRDCEQACQRRRPAAKINL